MKIVIVSPFYPFRGGLAQLNARLFTELSKNNEAKAVSFTTLYPGFLFPGKTQYLTEGDTAIEVPNERILSTVNPLSYFKTAKAINKFSPDVLLIPYWMSFFAPAYGTINRLINKKTKIVSLVHNAKSHERTLIETALAKYFLNSCDGFIVMSEPVKADLKKLIADPEILLLPHPLYDHYKEKTGRQEACRQLGIDPEKKNLLFFGFIRKYKGLDILIEAMRYLNAGYQLIIAGECYGDFGEYRKIIDNSPLKNNIKVFEQYIPDEMVTLLFSAADVLVLPYRSATQSGVVAIAYQLEIPIIATDVGALGEVVRTADTGIVVKEPVPEQLSEAIETYFSEPEKHSVYLQNIKKEKKNLSWESFTGKLEYFFKNLVSQK